MASLSSGVLFAVLLLVIGSTQSYAVSGFPSIDDHEERIHYNAPTKYKFSYGVNDPHTRDIKNQWEERDGDVVKGSYSLHESDGTVRIVEYTADNHNGFNAKVHKSGVATHSLDNNHFNHKIYHQ